MNWGIAVLLTVAVCISSGFIYEYVYFYEPNNKTIPDYTVSYDLPERKAAENKLAEYEVPRKFLAVLPDSELSLYGDLKSPENNPFIGPQFKPVLHNYFSFLENAYEPDDGYYPFITLSSDEYALPLRQEENGVVFRLLRITDYSMPDEDYEHFSRSVVGVFDYSSWSRHNIWATEEITVDASSETVLLADIENGEISFRDPIKKYKGLDGETTGYEFKIKRNTRLIYAVNILVKDGDGSKIHSSIDFVFKKKPIILKYRSAKEISDKHLNKSNETISATREFFNHQKTRKESVYYLDK